MEELEAIQPLWQERHFFGPTRTRVGALVQAWWSPGAPLVLHAAYGFLDHDDNDVTETIARWPSEGTRESATREVIGFADAWFKRAEVFALDQQKRMEADRG